MEKPKLGFNSRTIHGGQHPDPAYGAVMPPIYQTSTYAQKSPGDHKGYAYSRSANPTRSALERCLASIELGEHGFAFASGLAAIDTLLRLLVPGDGVIATDDLYGGSYRLFKKVHEKYGIDFHFVDLGDMEALEAACGERTRMIWVETPTNPMMNLVDLEAVSRFAKARHVLLAVDNTFATPYLQQPLELGADIVMHSATKYLGGHSDLVAGALVVRDPELARQIGFLQNACGAILGPMDSFLTLRGVKTLHLRMQRHCENAAVVAGFLQDHPKVEKVYWPGLETHRDHLLAKRQMRDFGGMMSFVPKGGKPEDAMVLVEGLRLFALAESLGGVESLVGHPASMSHGGMSREEREKTGVVDALIRLSVGVEEVGDLLEDLGQALDRI